MLIRVCWSPMAINHPPRPAVGIGNLPGYLASSDPSSSEMHSSAPLGMQGVNAVGRPPSPPLLPPTPGRRAGRAHIEIHLIFYYFFILLTVLNEGICFPSLSLGFFTCKLGTVFLGCLAPQVCVRGKDEVMGWKTLQATERCRDIKAAPSAFFRTGLLRVPPQ